MRPRTFFATLLPAAILLGISTVTLLPRERPLFPLTHLPRVVVAAETLLALLFFPLLVQRFREPNRFYALLIDSLIAFAASIPFIVLSALIASLSLRAAVVSQLLYLAMILFGVSLGTSIRSQTAVSLYFLTIFVLIAAVPLTGELVTQFAFPVNLSAVSPIIISMQTVTQTSVPLSAFAVIGVCAVVTALLWCSTLLQRKEGKTL